MIVQIVLRMGLGELPFYLHQGMSIFDELHDGVDMLHCSLTSLNNEPDACTLQCCTLGIGI